MTVVTRFAPSPTGFLHVGGARTALYSWAMARRHGGRFLLRIEDTDRTRYDAAAMQDIFESLRWLGLDWDEGPEKGGANGPYVQSERSAHYRAAAEQLLAQGLAYKCYCTAERLEEMRAQQQGSETGYDRRCRDLPADEREKLAAAGASFVVRFKMPIDGVTAFTDAIRGVIEYPNTQQDDFVILKTDGFPTYHLANVVDDHMMQVTHVMRGEEWIPSTPKHVRLYEAFGWQAPVFAHLPVILAADGGKLSKRHGAVSVREYRAAGYLPEALFNYLALLGWSPGDDREILSSAEIASLFDLERVSKRSAAFDHEKLQWMNGKYLESVAPERVVEFLRPELEKFGITDEKLASWGVPIGTAAWFTGIVALAKARVRLMPECIDKVRFFLDETITVPEELIAELKAEPDIKGRLEAGMQAILAAEPWSIETLDPGIRTGAKAAGFKPPKVMHPLRLATTGRKESPGIFETIFFIGRSRAVKRIQETLARL